MNLLNAKLHWTRRLICISCLIIIPILLNATDPPEKVASGRFDFTIPQNFTAIPFARINNHIVVPVNINGNGPYNFILDSGSIQAMLFDKKLAKVLGINFGRKIEFSGIGCNNTVVGYRSQGVDLTLPGIHGSRMGMVILNTDYLGFKKTGIHGVIGYQLFTRFAIKIDYSDNMLTLMDPEQYLSDGFEEIALQVHNSKPYLTSSVSLGNKVIPLRFLMDTGSSLSILIAGRHPAIQIPAGFKKQVIGKGLGGLIKGHQGFAIFKFGNLNTVKTLTSIVALDEYSKKGRDDFKMGLIGTDTLEHYLVIVDYANSRLCLRPRFLPDFGENLVHSQANPK